MANGMFNIYSLYCEYRAKIPYKVPIHCCYIGSLQLHAVTSNQNFRECTKHSLSYHNDKNSPQRGGSTGNDY